MNNPNNVVHLVGVRQDDGTVKNVKAFQNVTWALKYGAAAGDAARYAEVEIEWNTVAPSARVIPVKIAGKVVSAEIQ